MHYALNCGDRGIEIYSASTMPKLTKDVATALRPINGRDKLVRIIKLKVKGGKLIGNWAPTQASLVLPNLGEPGTLVRVNSSVVVGYNKMFNRVDQGA